MLEKILRKLESLIPPWLYHLGQPIYHWLLALTAATIYRFPSRSVRIVAITGTKGKSTTTEITASILETAGYRVASLSTIQFKIADDVQPNRFKMTVPGRFFVQQFLRKAVNAKCDWVVMEMSSEAVKQFRHKFISFDALIFTNLAPEHIERHGSYENYRDAKLRLARTIARSSKQSLIVANIDDAEGQRFLAAGADVSLPYSLADAEPHTTTPGGSTFTFHSKLVDLKLAGVFNIMNALGAATFAKEIGVPLDAIVEGINAVDMVRGRVEFIQREPFDAIVDYAHTPESLESLYKTFGSNKKICVLGNTGGGRDTWKRPVMAGIAERYCDEIILTNEDPYDDDPQEIVNQMARDIKTKERLTVIMDRREAIAHALERAHKLSKKPGHVSVLITGKGTDPYIMGANGTKTPWDDAAVVREELKKLSL